MMVQRILRAGVLIAALGAVAGCGGGLGGWFGGGGSDRAASETEPMERIGTSRRDSTIWDLFSNADPPNTTVEVNRYLWNASLEVLDFLPVQTVDPFSGVFVTGYGTPPGGGRAYRAAVMVNDPALDARSLKVALLTRSGPASAATIRAIEDAILTRARQLRIRDGGL